MELNTRREIIDVCRRLYLHNFVANHDGNVSARINKDRLIATPTAESKADIKEDWLLSLNMAGKILSGKRKPFSELKFHLAAYELRPDIKAVVHAHAPYTMALSCSGRSLSLRPFPEAIVSLGSEIKLSSFAIPGSQESADEVAKGLSNSDALLLANNGTLAVGSTPLEAYYRIELIEHIAKITLIAGKELIAIPDSAIGTLLKKRSELGFKTGSINVTERIISEVLKKINLSTNQLN